MSTGPSGPWRWVALPVVLAIHDRQISEHGGASGIRDSGGVESALARPMNLAAYGNPDVAELAAAYAFGLVRNHGFVDGNKRTAWVAARVFLVDNNQNLEFDPFDAIRIMEGVAGGKVSEDELADWFRSRLGTID